MNLPAVANARLPANYEAMTAAIASCARIDECQEWADKIAALASYARQADDHVARKLLDRVHARAVRRCGELLKEVEPQPGRRIGGGGDPNSRKAVANGAKLSERQRKTALRVASLSDEDFARQVESDNPPTVTELAERGKQSRPRPLVDLGEIPPADYARATEAGGTLAIELRAMGAGCFQHAEEIDRYRRQRRPAA